MDTMIFKILCQSIGSHISMHILIKNHTNGFCFFLIDKKPSFFQTVSIRSKSSVPFSFTGFLYSSLHCLYTDIFTLNFCNC